MHKFKPFSKFYLRLGDDFRWVPEEYNGSDLYLIVGNMPIGTIAVMQQTYKDVHIHQILETANKRDRQAIFTGATLNDVKAVSHDRLGGILGIPTDEVEQELIKLFKAFEIII